MKSILKYVFEELNVFLNNTEHVKTYRHKKGMQNYIMKFSKT